MRKIIFFLYCQVYKHKSPLQRHELVQLNKRCYSCLNKHFVKDCKLEKRCNMCKRKRHSSLHLSEPELKLLKQSLSKSNSQDSSNVMSTEQESEAINESIGLVSTNFCEQSIFYLLH